MNAFRLSVVAVIFLGSSIEALAANSNHHSNHSMKMGSMQKTASKSPGEGLSYSLGFSAIKTFASPDDPAAQDTGMGSMENDKKDRLPVDPMVMAMLSYNINSNLAIDTMVSAMSPMGLMDPTIGLSLNLPFGKKWNSYSSINASAPISKMSQEEFKTTTVTLSSGLLKGIGKFTAFGGFEGSMSWYKKTMYEADAEESTTLRLHGEMGDMEGESSDAEKTMMMMQMREFNHIGAFGGTHYDLTNNIRYHFDSKITRIGYMEEEPMWNTRVTACDIGYAFNGYMNMGFSSMPMGLSFNGALALIKSDPKPSMPSIPQLVVGVTYGGM